jgi:ABC-2 type transport system ATP-binding protein
MDIIEEQKRVGATVMMVTHQMDEVERLCDRIVLLKNGRAEAYGTVSEVQDLYGGTIIRIRYTGTIPDSPHFAVSLRERNYAELKFTNESDAAAVLKELVDAGVQVREFTTSKLSLEEIFLQVYGDHRSTDAER